jgi:hypothetical protein
MLILDNKEHLVNIILLAAKNNEHLPAIIKLIHPIPLRRFPPIPIILRIVPAFIIKLIKGLFHHVGSIGVEEYADCVFVGDEKL